MVDKTKLLLSLIGIGAVAGGGYYAYTTFVKPKDEEPPGTTPPGTEPDPCKLVPEHESIIIEVTMIPQSNPLHFGFKAVYKNKSCISQSFTAIRQVFDKNGVPVLLSEVSMTLKPNEAAGIEGNHIFSAQEREIGQNKFVFLAWRSPTIPIALSKKITIFV